MKISAFVNDRLANMRDLPRMWGSPEANELVMLQLIELEHAFYSDPNPYEDKAESQDRREVLGLYTEELRARFGQGNVPLHRLVNGPEFDGQLFDIGSTVRAKLKDLRVARNKEAESPFGNGLPKWAVAKANALYSGVVTAFNWGDGSTDSRNAIARALVVGRMDD